MIVEMSRSSPALLFAAEPVHRHGAQRHGRLQRDRHRRVDRGQFLDGKAEGEDVAAHPAVLLGEGQPEQPELAHLGHDVVGELASLVVVSDHRRHHLAGEFGDGRA